MFADSHFPTADGFELVFMFVTFTLGTLSVAFYVAQLSWFYSFTVPTNPVKALLVGPTPYLERGLARVAF